MAEVFTKVLIAIVLAAAALPTEAAEKTSLDPRRAFQRAFTAKMAPRRRVALLESIAKEHPESPWADDALWALGEVARRNDDPRRVVCYWQYLMNRRPDAELEDYTRTLQLYRTSTLPQIELLLLSEGNSYVMDEPEVREGQSATLFLVKNARRFNPLPMVVWEEVGECCAELDKPRVALRAYRKALQAAPEKGRWRTDYWERIQRLEERLEALPPEQEGEDSSAEEGAEATGKQKQKEESD